MPDHQYPSAVTYPSSTTYPGVYDGGADSEDQDTTPALYGIAVVDGRPTLIRVRLN